MNSSTEKVFTLKTHTAFRSRYCFLHPGLVMATSWPWKSRQLKRVCHRTWSLWRASWRAVSPAVSRGRSTTTPYSTRSPPPPWPGSFSLWWPTKTGSALKITRSPRQHWTRWVLPSPPATVNVILFPPLRDLSAQLSPGGSCTRMLAEAIRIRATPSLPLIYWKLHVLPNLFWRQQTDLYVFIDVEIKHRPGGSGTHSQQGSVYYQITQPVSIQGCVWWMIYHPRRNHRYIEDTCNLAGEAAAVWLMRPSLQTQTML